MGEWTLLEEVTSVYLSDRATTNKIGLTMQNSSTLGKYITVNYNWASGSGYMLKFDKTTPEEYAMTEKYIYKIDIYNNPGNVEGSLVSSIEFSWSEAPTLNNSATLFPPSDDIKVSNSVITMPSGTGQFKGKMYRKTLDTTGKLKDQSPGTIIRFANSLWTIVDPISGYILKKTPVSKAAYDVGDIADFLPNRAGNIANYLNDDFYNRLSEKERNAIATKNWGVGGINEYEGGSGNVTPTLSVIQMLEKENTKTVAAKIGLISLGEWRKYSKKWNASSGVLPSSKNMWLRTPTANGGSNQWIAFAEGTTTYVRAYRANDFDVLPTAYVNRDLILLQGSVMYNALPVVNLITADKKTLYENDTLTVDGDAVDSDGGDVVNVKYQINSGTIRAITAGISDGVTPIPFSKQLTFKLGKLYDGDLAVTETLSDGIAHALKVWAEDDKGGKSVEQVRTFHVVANRPPGITIDSFITVSDLINADSIEITGTTTDPEAQNVKVRYNVNEGAFTEFHNGAAGAFTVNIGLDKLKNGANTIQFQVEDSYAFVTSKTLTITKTFNATPLLFGVARYKPDAIVGGVKDMVAWIEKTTGDLAIDMEASLVLSSEQENFIAMNNTNTAPIDSITEEKEFSITDATAKDDLAIKINMSRTSAASVDAITKITGTMQ